MLKRGKLYGTRVQVEGLLPLTFKLLPQQNLAVLSSQKFIMQALANIIHFVGNGLIEPLHLSLQLLHPGKSAAELGVELRILRLQVGFLHAQSLQGRAWDYGGHQLGVSGTCQAVASLFDNPVSLGICQLRIQMAQPVDDDVIIPVSYTHLNP